MRRKLVVRREVLSPLTPDEARAVVGGLSGYSCVGVCMTRLDECLTREYCTTVTQGTLCDPHGA